MARKLKFFTCGIDCLEYRTIDSILRKHDSQLTDIHHQITTYDLGDIRNYMALQVRDGDVACFLPSVPVEMFEDEPFMEQVTILGPNKIVGGMSVLAQICAIIGHQTTRYENLVSAFAAGHIKGLRAAGATEEEVKQICLRDRLARGSSLQDECIIAEYVNELRPQVATRNHTLVHEALMFHGEESVLDQPECQMAFFDYLLGRADEGGVVTIIFNHLNEDYRAARAEVFTNSKQEITTMQRVAMKYGYIMTTHTRDLRTGLHTFRLILTDKSKRTGAFRPLLEKYRRPKF